jgi:hypothetical protein
VPIAVANAILCSHRLPFWKAKKWSACGTTVKMKTIRVEMSAGVHLPLPRLNPGDVAH